MQTQTGPSDSLVFECDFEEPPEKVWRALTEPRLLAAWLTTGDSPRSDPREEQTASREAPPADYEIVTAEPHRLLRYRWRDREGDGGDPHGCEVHSVVTVELAPCPAGGTHLRLTHGDFRIVSTAPSMTAACVTPITSARRRQSPIPSFATRSHLRRAA